MNNQLPEKIRLNLKKFKTHRDVTCLECGYVGLMGINNSKLKAVFFWLIMVGLCIFLSAIGISFYVIFFIAFFSIIFKKIFFGDSVVCPNCENELEAR